MSAPKPAISFDVPGGPSEWVLHTVVLAAAFGGTLTVSSLLAARRALRIGPRPSAGRRALGKRSTYFRFCSLPCAGHGASSSRVLYLRFTLVDLKLATSRRRAVEVSREDIRGCARACLRRVHAANRLA